MRKIIKNISYSLVANVISLVLGMLSVLVFPKLIGVEEFGYYQLYIFYTCYVTITALGWVDGIYLENGGMKYEELNKEELNAQFWLMTISQVILYTVLCMGVIRMDDIDKRSILLIVCGGAIIIHMRYFCTLIIQATNRIKEYAYIVITERVFSIIAGLIIILLGYRGYLWLIVLDMLGRAISMLFAVGYCRDIVFARPVIERAYCSVIRKYMISGSMVLFATLASTLVIGIVRYAIEDYWDIATFSKVSLTISISNMAVRCINSIGIVMFPTLRRLDKEKLPRIYELMNRGLMLVIFMCLIFYQPLALLLKLWLPQYADSVQYAAILLPVCAYECKNVMLVSTYLKSYCAEKALFVTNLVSIVLSVIFTFFTVYVLHSVELAVLSMLISLMVRCILGELYLEKKMGISLLKSICFEATLVAAFVICNWYLGVIGMLVYMAAYAVYVVDSQRQIKQMIQCIRKRNYESTV